MGKQQQQLESLLSEVAREREAARAAASESEKMRNPRWTSCRRACLKQQRAEAAEAAELRDSLRKTMAEAEETERRLMAQLSERSAALAALTDELQEARQGIDKREDELARQVRRSDELASELKQARADASVTQAHVERLESDRRPARTRSGRRTTRRSSWVCRR